MLHRQGKTHLARKCYRDAQAAFAQAQVPLSSATDGLIQQILNEPASVRLSQVEHPPLFLPSQQHQHSPAGPLFSSPIPPASFDDWSLEPERAVLLFQEALQRLDGEEPLLRAAIHSGLAAALAQCRREQEALESLEQAQTWFPSSPERDPSFGLVGCGQAEFSFWVGEALLDLAQHAPQQGYDVQAQQTFEQGLALPAITDRNTSQMLIGRAAAALGLGDLELYEASLRGGLVLAREIGSQKRFVEAQTIFQQTPRPWLTDRRLQALKDEFFLPV